MRRPPPGPILAGVGIATALLYFVGLATDLPALRFATKPFPALALAAWVALRSPAAPGRLTAAGLLLSAIGDVLLGAGAFAAGLLAFLSAHVAYLAAFVSIDHRPALVRALPFLGWGLGAFVLLRPGLGAMALPVGAYVAAICAMMWRAAAQVGSPGTSALAAALALVGAVCFGASDTLLAFARFSAPIPGVRWPIMALYWLGQGGIAASAVLGAERRRAGTGGGWGMLPGQVKTR